MAPTAHSARMLAGGGIDTWPRHDIGGAVVAVGRSIEMTDTPDGQEPIDWTKVQAAATNTVLVMSIGNPGEPDLAWHESVWRSIRQQHVRRASSAASAAEAKRSRVVP